MPTTTMLGFTYSYNPITGGTSSMPWVYNYVSDIPISDSISYVYDWTNSTGVVIPSVYVLIVGEGGVGFTYAPGYGALGGTGGSGGGQVSLFQFNNVQPGDTIQVNYNEASGNSSYCYLTYFSGGIAQNLTQIGACYYNTPDYATGTTLSSIIFSNTNFVQISDGGPLVPLLINNNTNIMIYYGGEGKQGGNGGFGGEGANGGDGGTGGGGSGGGGGNYSGGSNGSRGTQNYNLGSYGGMKGGSSSSSDCRDGGYTPLCMPDGTGTSSLPAGALLGKAGNGTDGDSNSYGEPGASGSIMVFYPTN